MEMTMAQMEAAIEAVLFTMGDSVETSKLALAIGQDTDTTRKIVRNLSDKYKSEDRGIKIIELEDSFQMCTKPECYEALVKVVTAPKKHILTDAILETLSIIAYKQPVTKVEIEKIRGVSCDFAVNKLYEQPKDFTFLCRRCHGNVLCLLFNGRQIYTDTIWT